MANSSMRKARDRARKGAAWLDKNEPGWRERVNADELKMASSSSCVLGQLYNGFNNAVPRYYERYVIDYDPWLEDRREAAWLHFARYHGFYSESDEFEGEDPTYDELGRAWQEILGER